MPHQNRSSRPHRRLGLALLCLALALPLDAQGAAVRQVTPPRPGRPCYTPPALPTAIALSDTPHALAIATGTCRAFVRNSDGSVNVLDLTRGTLLRTVQVSEQRGGGLAPVVAVDDRTQRVFVANSGDSLHEGSVSVLDAASGAVVRTVSPGVHPVAVAIDSQRGRVFVANNGSGSVSILDAATGAVLRTIPVEGRPALVAVDARRARVFVAADMGEHGAVSTLEETTGRLLRTAPIAGIPAVLVADAQSGHVFVGPTSEGGAIAGRLSILDATSGAVLRSIDLLRAEGVALGDLDVHGLAVDARTGHLFVAWTGTYQVEPTASGVSMLDAASGALLKRIAVGEFPTAVVVDEQEGHAFVTHRDIVNSEGDPSGNGSLSVLDTASGRVVATIPVGWGPTAMALDAQTGLLLVANQGINQGTISIVRVRPRHALPTDPVPPARGARYFPHTRHNLGGPFLAFWQRYGGLATFGEPRTEPFHERGSLVQYTDRFELERVGGQVDTFRLGYMLTSQRTIPRVAPVASTPTRLYFAGTGHTLSGRFLAYWRTHHGATLLGAPLSEVIMEGNGDGSGRRYPLQWFEKGRLEYHPELAGTRYALELGLLGVQVLQQRGWLP
jgi:YVTN family beta-propeller protein